jgi:MFS superfamily sulfate permease-like transporter
MGSMTELIIGIVVGMACAAALLVMWRMAEKLRRDLQSEDKTTGEQREAGPHRSEKSHRNNHGH